MKKTLLYAAAGFLLFAASCKETLNPIVLDNTEGESDTSYTVNTIPPAEARRNYIEELTGVQCTNCPNGAQKLKEMDAEYLDELSIIAFHAEGTPQFNKPYSKGVSVQDFRTDDGNAIYSGVFRSIGKYGDNKPSAIFGRNIKNPNETNPDNKTLFVDNPANWSPALLDDRQRNPSTPVNLEISSKYNEATNAYDIFAKVTYTQAVTTSNALQIYLSEDDITDAQLSGKVQNEIDPSYVFEHVFRKCLSSNPVTGKIIPGKDKKPGFVYEYRNSFKIDLTDEKQKNWKPKDMHVTAFVSIANNPDDLHVLQVKETKLTD